MVGVDINVRRCLLNGFKILLVKLNVMSRKLMILRLDDTSISNPSNLKVLIIFWCIIEVLGLLLFGMKMKPPSLYKPTCLRSIILPRVSNILIPIKLAICAELYAYMRTSKLSMQFLNQVDLLSVRIDSQQVISICSSVIFIKFLAWFKVLKYKFLESEGQNSIILNWINVFYFYT